MDRRSFVKKCVYSSLIGISALFGIKYAKDKIDDDKPRFPYIAVQLADHCNLNCKYCSHFSPIADVHFYDLKQYEQDIKRLSKITEGRVDIIRVMGGEPLLNRDINKYLIITRKHFPKSSITVVTNCLLLEKMDESFWKTLNKYNIVLDPSIYKVNLNWKNLVDIFRKYKIKIRLRDNGKPIEKFHTLGLDLKGSQKKPNKCRECPISFECYHLNNGKIYICNVVANIKYFNKKFKQNLLVTEKDFVNLSDVKNINELLDWAKAPKDFCRYCGEIVYVPWEHSDKHTIDEWL